MVDFHGVGGVGVAMGSGAVYRIMNGHGPPQYTASKHNYEIIMLYWHDN